MVKIKKRAKQNKLADSDNTLTFLQKRLMADISEKQPKLLDFCLNDKKIDKLEQKDLTAAIKQLELLEFSDNTYRAVQQVIGALYVIEKSFESDKSQEEQIKAYESSIQNLESQYASEIKILQDYHLNEKDRLNRKINFLEEQLGISRNSELPTYVVKKQKFKSAVKKIHNRFLTLCYEIASEIKSEKTNDIYEQAESNGNYIYEDGADCWEGLECEIDKELGLEDDEDEFTEDQLIVLTWEAIAEHPEDYIDRNGHPLNQKLANCIIQTFEDIYKKNPNFDEIVTVPKTTKTISAILVYSLAKAYLSGCESCETENN